MSEKIKIKRKIIRKKQSVEPLFKEISKTSKIQPKQVFHSSYFKINFKKRNSQSLLGIEELPRKKSIVI